MNTDDSDRAARPDPVLRLGLWLRRHVLVVLALTVATAVGFGVWLAHQGESTPPSVSYVDTVIDMNQATFRTGMSGPDIENTCDMLVRAAGDLAAQDGTSVDPATARTHCVDRMSDLTRRPVPIVTQQP